ncbi:MAG: L-glutamate gamma-semialdehyde dehydrogenase [Symbiobacteriia bacterium]
MLAEFKNEPGTNYGLPENQEAMLKALDFVAKNLGKEYPLVIGGEKIMTQDKIKSINPAQISEVVGYVSKADQALAEKAMQAALTAFETWRFVEPAVRARILFKAAALMRRRKHEFSSWMVYEVGKTWPEADADTAEAIDFLEFYGREMIRLAESQPLTRYMGEDNEQEFIPLGVGVVIPPWNFPLAILVGMTSASIVAGNTVLLKPASVSPIIGYKFVELMEQAGLPKGVLNFVPGSGGTIGDYLVGHPKTRFIAFTGSMEVGLHINELAAKTAPGQKWVKRVVAEMGGKDAILVDSEADLEEAALGIVTSAFGYGGQKCSACSRAIIHQDVYDQVLNRVAELTEALRVGDPRDPKTNVGPVVDKGAHEKNLEFATVIGKQEGRLVVGGEKGPDHGYFVMPTVYADVDRKARLFQEEIFGPVLAVSRAKDWDHAIELGNDSLYGLTGAVYSRNRLHLEKARKEFHVGNLYINRKCTGALVGVHPFGGFNMSGTDSKAGGREYLLLFTQAKAVSEKF